MEGFISSFESRPTGQKVLIGVFIAGLLLLLVVLSAIATQPKPQPVTHITPTPTVVPQQTSKSTFPTASIRSDKTYTYRGNHFEVTYSGDIYTASGNKDNGEDNIVLMHTKKSTLDPDNYTISFMIVSSSQVPVQGIYRVFDSFKYPKSNIDFRGVQAVRYSGSTTLGGSAFHDTAIIFTKNNLTYKIELTYQSNAVNSVAEDAFNQILSSVQIY